MSIITCPVHDIAHAWRQHAQFGGVTDPDVQVMAIEAVDGSPRAGYRPAFRAPGGDLVTIFTCQPHRTAAEAHDWLFWMLEQLHHNGNITLYREAA